MLTLANISSPFHRTHGEQSIAPPSLKKNITIEAQALIDAILHGPQKPIFEVTVIGSGGGGNGGDGGNGVGEEASPETLPPITSILYERGRVFGDSLAAQLPLSSTESSPLLQPAPHNSLLDEIKAAQKEYAEGVENAKGLAKLVSNIFSYLHRCKKNIPFISSIVEMNHFTYAAYALIPPIIKAATHISFFIKNSTFKSKLDNSSIAQTFSNQAIPQSETAASTALQPERISAQADWVYVQRRQAVDRKGFHQSIGQFLIKELPNVILAFVIKLTPLAKGAKKPLIEIVKSLNQIYVSRSLLTKQKELIYSLNPIQDLSQTDAVSKFLDRLKKCQNFQEVKDEFKSADINEEILPEQFEQFRFLMEHNARYQNDISNRYLYSLQRKSPFTRLSQPHLSNTPIARPYANGQYIEQLLRRRQIEVETKIASMKQDIKNKIDATANTQSFEPIKTYFKALSIDLDDIQVNNQPVTNRDLLLLAKNDDQLMERLAKSRLSAIETKASSVVHAIRATLLSKHPEERDFLKFTVLTSTISALFGGIEISCVFSQKIKSFFSETLIKSFSKNLINLPNIGLIFVLFPKTSIKVLAIFLAIAKHIFSKQYKPNEYSAEGYKLGLKIGVLTAIHYFYLAMLFFQKTFLWVDINLIEARIMKMEIQANDPRYDEIETDWQQSKTDFREKKNPLDEAYQTLQTQDVDFMLNPNSKGKNIEGESLDAIKTIISTLDKEDFQYYQQEVQDFLNRHLDLAIRQDGSTTRTQVKIADKVKELFTSEGETFIRVHQENQALHPFISH
jgi:hypothetical protein